MRESSVWPGGRNARLVHHTEAKVEAPKIAPRLLDAPTNEVIASIDLRLVSQLPWHRSAATPTLDPVRKCPFQPFSANPFRRLEVPDATATATVTATPGYAHMQPLD